MGRRSREWENTRKIRERDKEHKNKNKKSDKVETKIKLNNTHEEEETNQIKRSPNILLEQKLPQRMSRYGFLQEKKTRRSFWYLSDAWSMELMLPNSQPNARWTSLGD